MSATEVKTNLMAHLPRVCAFFHPVFRSCSLSGSILSFQCRLFSGRLLMFIFDAHIMTSRRRPYDAYFRRLKYVDNGPFCPLLTSILGHILDVPITYIFGRLKDVIKGRVLDVLLGPFWMSFGRTFLDVCTINLFT